MRTEIQHSVETLTDLIIPSKSLSILPFSKEAISEWTEDTDLNKFLFEIYNPTGYGEVSEDYFQAGIEQFEMWAELFFNIASQGIPSPASVSQNIEIPNFIENSMFGYLAKNMTAWENIIDNILSEGSYYSLPHILETKTDLASSIHLAAHLYYKQAYQVLRSFLESVVLPVHFCKKPDQYIKWKNNDCRTPSLRGKTGLLKKLRKAGIIGESLENEISDLYGKLNGYIHNSEKTMNNKGIHSGEWAGFVFQETEFNNWVITFSQCVEASLKLLRIHHKQWESNKPKNQEICNICHSSELIKTENEERDLIQFQCEVCGSTFNTKKNGDRVVISSIEFYNES